MNQEKESLVLARLVAQILDEKKGEDVRVLDLRKVHGAPAEFFVIASGNVPSHVSAMSDAVHEMVKKATGLGPHKVEGYNNAEWILMDYFDVGSATMDPMYLGNLFVGILVILALTRRPVPRWCFRLDEEPKKE